LVPIFAPGWPGRFADDVTINALRRVQQELEELYALEPGPNITDYVRIGPRAKREELLVREVDGAVEMALTLPYYVVVLGADRVRNPSDALLELIEGVSHFVHVAERARADLPTTLLELELQAEVDKFVLLGFIVRPSGLDRIAHHEAIALFATLFEGTEYLHPADTRLGELYRTASDFAARFVARLLAVPSNERVLALLRRFYRSGQADKVWLATAA
jgi:hypothetical protein